MTMTTSLDRPHAVAAPTDDEATTRKRDPEATRAAILEAAAALFVDLGPADVPTSLIAKRAGVTKSLIHHHFGSKEELWHEVKRRHFELYYQAQKDLLARRDGTVQLLEESFLAYFRYLQADPDAVRFMSWRFVEGDDPCLDQEHELFEMGQARIREAQERGELRADIQPLSMIKAFLAMSLHWFQTKPFLCQMLGDAAGDIAQIEEVYLADVRKIFLEGIKPR